MGGLLLLVGGRSIIWRGIALHCLASARGVLVVQSRTFLCVLRLTLPR